MLPTNRKLKITIPADIKHFEVTQIYTTPDYLIKDLRQQSNSVKRQSQQKQPITKDLNIPLIKQRRFTQDYKDHQNNMKTNSPYTSSKDRNRPKNIATNNIYTKNIYLQSAKNNKDNNLDQLNQSQDKKNLIYTPKNLRDRQQYFKFANCIDQLRNHKFPQNQNLSHTISNQNCIANKLNDEDEINLINTLQQRVTEPALTSKDSLVPKKYKIKIHKEHNNTQTQFKQKQQKFNLLKVQYEYIKQINQKAITDDEQMQIEDLITNIPRDAKTKRKFSIAKTLQTEPANLDKSYTINPDRKISITKIINIDMENSYYMKKMREFQQGENSESEFSQIFLDHFTQNFNSMVFSKKLRRKNINIIRQKQLQIPARQSKCRQNIFISQVPKTVIFDLDETLIHCNDNSEIQSDIYLPIVFPHGDIVEYFGWNQYKTLCSVYSLGIIQIL